jgi:hypothetical protein
VTPTRIVAPAPGGEERCEDGPEFHIRRQRLLRFSRSFEENHGECTISTRRRSVTSGTSSSGISIMGGVSPPGTDLSRVPGACAPVGRYNRVTARVTADTRNALAEADNRCER